MLNKVRSRLSAPLLISVIALFVALGGAAFAVQKAPKNSVTSKSIKKNAVTSSDIKNDSVTGNDVNESSLKLSTSALPNITYQNAGPIQYGKDGFGVVHLRGNATGIAIGGTIATLPAGFRPAATGAFPVVGGFSSPCSVDVGSDGQVRLFGTGSCNTLVISVDGITFSAA
jgi:hypothetical protein